jgi:hypothetical protein
MMLHRKWLGSMKAPMDLEPPDRAPRPPFWLSTRTRTLYFLTFDGETLDLLPSIEGRGSQLLRIIGVDIRKCCGICRSVFFCSSEMPDENGRVNTKFNPETVYIWRVGSE